MGVQPVCCRRRNMAVTWGRYSGGSTSSSSKRNAHAMRAEPTQAERKLWWILRHDLALRGTHFRRQVAIGSYIVDFVCLSAKLIVEVDGEQHGFDDGVRRDTRRAGFLKQQGYRIVRFWNREVLTESRMVADTIFATLQETSPQTVDEI